MNLLIVTGTFDEKGGKPSSVGALIASALVKDFHRTTTINGGFLGELNKVLINVCAYKYIIWMPNVSNDVPKHLEKIKALNRKCILVSSKRVVEKDYTEADIIGRLLKSKSNLGIMIKQTDLDLYKFTLLDPLGNIWAETADIGQFCWRLAERMLFLGSMTRAKSTKIGEVDPFEIPDDFLRSVKNYGERFSKFVNAINPNRLLGNAATRCSGGFPGIRNGGRYLVSRRNVEKTTISKKDFVELNPVEVAGVIGYYGDKKPSVDAPIQIHLFNYYKNVKYIIHGHVYEKDGIFTEKVVPCGSLEEAEEVKKVVPDSLRFNFTINLRGHGCLIMAQDISYLNSRVLRSRPFPEEHYYVRGLCSHKGS